MSYHDHTHSVKIYPLDLPSTVGNEDLQDVIDVSNRIIHISTTKSRATAAGTFRLVLKRYHSNDHRDQYDYFNMLQPMDYVEIRFGAINGNDVPMKMRGFIDSVSLSREMKNNTGDEYVIVDGRDYGKLLLNNQLYYLKYNELLNKIFEQAGTGLYAKYKIAPGTHKLGELLAKITTIVDANIGLMNSRRELVPKLGRHFTLPHQYTYPIMSETYTGALWNFMQKIICPPFNEIFVVDTEDAPVLVARPAQMRDVNRDYVFPDVGRDRKLRADYVGQGVDLVGAFNRASITGGLKGTMAQLNGYYSTEASLDYTLLTITNADISSISTGRTDNDIVNYLFVVDWFLQAVSNKSNSEFMSFTYSEGGDNPDIKNPYVNISSISKYGYRPLELTMNFGLLLDTATNVLQTSKDNADLQAKIALNPQDAQVKDYINGILQMSYAMVKACKYNEYYEQGKITVGGSVRDQVQVGRYIQNTDEDVLYYIEQVSHTYSPLGTYETTISVSRGDRFIRENKSELTAVETPSTEYQGTLATIWEKWGSYLNNWL